MQRQVDFRFAIGHRIAFPTCAKAPLDQYWSELMTSPPLIEPRDPGVGVDRVLDEMDRAIAEEGIDAAGMAASRAGEFASLVTLVVAAQLLTGLAVAQRARVSGGTCAGSGSAERRNIVVVGQAVAHRAASTKVQ